MAGDAHKTTVGDYVTLVRGTTYKGTLVSEPGPALLGLGSIEPGGGFRIGKYKTYGGDCPEELMLFPGDIYASLKGATKDGKMIGSVARVPPSVTTGRLTQDTVKLVFRNRDPVAETYLYWVLRTPQYRDYCAGHATGSAVVALSRRDFLSYAVPPLTTQRRMVSAVLDTIEEKIELNRKINETLEAMARALFKSWFVDFDPVRAKAEGRDTGLPKHIADLFPDSFGDSELGEIPRGWDAATLYDLATLNPESWSSETRPEVIEYVDLSNTKWGRIEVVTSYSKKDAPSRAQRVLRSRDTILGTVRPGNGSYAQISADGLTGSTGFAALRPSKYQYSEFLYLAATAPENIDRLAHLADGAAYPAVRPEVVAATQVVKPDDEVMRSFSCVTSPMLSKVAASEAETGTLAALRETLLPKLISGELRLKDAERILGRKTV
ncbi:MAG: restriction endonuclease subunit S [Nitrospira sp.]|nr:restriction endonuclease subunit S [Nitrospira sp.]MCW5778517.1 restriction endonuclease subunit S [Nitrospira sp.]